MDYQKFLFNKLMCLYNTSFEKLEYDLQYNHTLKLWEDFQASGLDNPSQPLYECIVDYIEGNKEFFQYNF